MLPKKISRRNIKNSPRYSQKTWKIMDFLYTIPWITVTWQIPRADKVSKVVLKVVQEDFSNTSKKLFWLHLPFFFNIFFRLGGVVPPPPQMLLTVNRIINWNICAQFREVSEWYFLLISSVLLYWSLLCCKLCYIRSMFLFLYSQTSDGNHVALHIYWSNVNIVWYEHISNMYMYRFCYHYWLYHTDKKLPYAFG